MSDFKSALQVESKGADVVWGLLESINNLVVTTEWDPSDIKGFNTVRMIEVKAMLMNAEKKLLKIGKEEGYIEK